MSVWQYISLRIQLFIHFDPSIHPWITSIDFPMYSQITLCFVSSSFAIWGQKIVGTCSCVGVPTMQSVGIRSIRVFFGPLAPRPLFFGLFALTSSFQTWSIIVALPLKSGWGAPTAPFAVVTYKWRQEKKQVWAWWPWVGQMSAQSPTPGPWPLICMRWPLFVGPELQPIEPNKKIRTRVLTAGLGLKFKLQTNTIDTCVLQGFERKQQNQTLSTVEDRNVFLPKLPIISEYHGINSRQQYCSTGALQLHPVWFFIFIF